MITWGLVAALAIAAPADTITNGRELVQAMHERYVGAWYGTLSFEQRTTFYNLLGRVEREEVWSEYMHLPGRVRVDIGARDQGNLIIFRADSVYQFREGEMVVSEPRIHGLLLLGFDIYHQPPEETMGRLESLGFDLDTMHERQWRNRTVYVAGAVEGDLTSPQFWIDASDLIVVRQIQPAGERGESTSEVQFNKYEPLEGGWISQEVVFLLDGEMRLIEEATNVEANVELDDMIFDPAAVPPPARVQ